MASSEAGHLLVELLALRSIPAAYLGVYADGATWVYLTAGYARCHCHAN